MGDVQVVYMAVNSTYTKLDLYRIFQHVKSQFHYSGVLAVTMHLEYTQKC